VCAKVQPAVSGLEQQFGSRVKAHNIDATTPESKAAIQQLGFRNHGLVVRDSEGQVLWKQADHEVDMQQVQEEVQRLLESPGG